MTSAEFNSTKFGADMKIKLIQDDSIHEIVSVDFETEMFGIPLPFFSEELTWIKCSDVELII